MLLLLLLACSPDAAPPTSPPPSSPEPRTIVAVSGYTSGDIHLYDTAGVALGVLAGVDGAQTVVVSPEGELVACAEKLDQVLRFDAETFEPLGVLVDGSAGFDGPTAAIYGPDGRLYVASFEDDRVARFEADGTYVDDAVPAGAGGLDGPDIGMAFGPDGALVIPSWYNGSVLSYADGIATALVTPEDGWEGPRALAWNAGSLLVSMNGSNAVVRVGDGVSLFIEPRGPTGMAILGDRLLVASGATDKVLAWNLASGEPEGVFLPADGVVGASALAVLELP
ncbi:MAG: hypothetical protein V4850_22975 [Myxococcota bacterium]